ncbi:MAG: AarF/ABC1/UbiB kinase family protein [Thermomicrobium sp.]|nr:AarF/ABC1/UbiB kinase family protein [Thermomicrobium sp.]MDW7981721.1 AarF/ABC1/UbiB kinase family protein [Thermomicrobium sp.]
MTPRSSWPRQLLVHRRRVTEIAGILSRHGLAWLLDQLGIPLQPRPKHAPGSHPVPVPVRLRLALEELGPTFIKLGQILSTRPDLLPPPYIEQLALLRDRLPPVPVEQIIAEIERSFGRPLEELYTRFDPVPIASASIGQVHAATLPTGTSVIVKVRKPGIADVIEEDLALLRDLAATATRRSQLARLYDLTGLVDEFAWTIRSELDYRREGRNADRFRILLRDRPDIVIPRVFWHRTTDTVLTMRRIEGIPIDRVDELDRAGIDRTDLALRAARFVLDCVLVHGFFHADPHPGNFAVLPDGRIVVYDFGMVGRLDPGYRAELLDALIALVRNDLDALIDSLSRLGIVRHEADRPALRRELQHLVDRYLGLSLGEYRMGEIAEDFFRLIRRWRLTLPPELSLLMKTLSMHEGVGQRLDPQFRPFQIAEPYVRRLIVERYLPASWFPHLLRMAEDGARQAVELPRRVDRLLRRIEQAELEVTMHLAELPEATHQLNALVNRLIIAILLAAAAISFSLLLNVWHPAWFVSWAGPLLALGLASIVIATLVVAWQLWRNR